MKILVTGGAGYVGTEVVGLLAAHEAVSEVVVYDNLSRPNYNFFLGSSLPAGRIRFVRADILDTRRLRAELDGVDVVLHLAARVTTPFADVDFHGLDQVNHWGSAELGYLLETLPVKRCVYLSSTSVYGASDSPVGVGDRPAPGTAYGVSKLRGEQMLERLQDRLDVHVVRCGNVYGYSRSMRFEAVINRFMFEARYSGRLTIHGTGHQRRAFVHVGTVARALVATAVGEGLAPGTVDLVEATHSVLEVSSHIQDLFPDLELLFIQQDMRLRNLDIREEPRVAPFLDERTFAEQLRSFRDQFSFVPRAG